MFGEIALYMGDNALGNVREVVYRHYRGRCSGQISGRGTSGEFQGEMIKS